MNIWEDNNTTIGMSAKQIKVRIAIDSHRHNNIDLRRVGVTLAVASVAPLVF